MVAKKLLMNYSEDGEEYTLGAIADMNAEMKKINCFGIILHAAHYYPAKPTDKEFILLKVIDPSFNCDAKIQNKRLNIQNFVTVYIYKSPGSELPEITKVGDILRMRRFDFHINSLGELVGVSQPSSNWLIYACNKSNNIKPMSNKCFNEKNLSLQNYFEVESVNKLLDL